MNQLTGGKIIGRSPPPRPNANTWACRSFKGAQRQQSLTEC